MSNWRLNWIDVNIGFSIDIGIEEKGKKIYLVLPEKSWVEGSILDGKKLVIVSVQIKFLTFQIWKCGWN